MSTEDVTKVDQIRLVVEAIKRTGDKIDWGNGQRLEFHAEDVPLQIGRADLMLIDVCRKTLYVVEVIPGEATAEDVGRLLSYYGWLRKNLLPDLTPTQNLMGLGSWFRPADSELFLDVKGVVLGERFGAAALCALAGCPEVIVKTYSFSIQIN